MNKPLRPSYRLLSSEQMQRLCDCETIDLLVEVNFDGDEWLALETLKSMTSEGMVEALKEIADINPGRQTRAIDLKTGRIVYIF